VIAFIAFIALNRALWVIDLSTVAFRLMLLWLLLIIMKMMIVEAVLCCATCLPRLCFAVIMSTIFVHLIDSDG